MEAETRHRHQPLSASDVELEEGGSAAVGAQTVDLVRKATRGARGVAALALVLAAASSTGTALLLYRLHRVEADALHASFGQSVSLVDDSLPDRDPAAAVELPGYFRVYLNTVVRQDRDLQSDRVGILTVGDRVFGVERYGRRIRIEHPLRGWMSTATREGVDILRPDEDLLGVHAPNVSGLARVARDPEAKATADAIRKRAAAFTDVENKLISMFNKVNEFVIQNNGRTVGQVIQTKEISAAGKAIVGGALELSKRTAETVISHKQAAEQLLQQKISPEARDHLVQGIKFSPDKLFGQEGTKMVNAWKQALGK
mmetsp:Transcript_25690/g.73854  ORF Transcript_25690/g.73854 Transcript_25690/m.73854 type:complete len:314 (-) Transcript_25690:94-1035(-)